MERDIQLLVHRATPLVFGVFAHMAGPDGTRIVRLGGSGIFIAPFQALTARHVSRDFFRMESRPDRVTTITPGYFETEHSCALFQILEPLQPTPRQALWQVDRTWDPMVTDISFVQVSAEEGDALRNQVQMPTGFFDWSLLPPPIGSQVVMLGYPKTEISTRGDLMDIGVKYVIQVGHVREIHELRRDRGMLTFPCFRIDQPIDPGFSGGPVFWEGKLCGIVSSDSFGETYAASLWPICLMEYEYPDLGVLGAKKSFGTLFENGVLHAADWPAVKDRITKRYDDNHVPYAYISE